MKTYNVSKHTSRLAAYFVAIGWPFHFDGEAIEFTASTEFIERLKETDAKFKEIFD